MEQKSGKRYYYSFPAKGVVCQCNLNATVGITRSIISQEVIPEEII